jgi:hypothetical protein
MIVWLSAIPFVLVLIYFLNQRRQTNQVWRRFRQRQNERRGHPQPDSPTDTGLQFDQPAADVNKEKPRNPN